MVDFLKSFRTILITFVIGALVGFSFGYATSTNKAKAKSFDAVTQGQKQTATNVIESIGTSQAIDQEVAASSQRVDDLAAQAVKSMKLIPKNPAPAPALKQEGQAQPEEPHETPICRNDGWTLDVGTVRMLNSAREWGADGPASVGDGSGAAFAEIRD